MAISLRKTYWFIKGFAQKYRRVVLFSVVGVVAVLGFLSLVWPNLPKPKLKRYVGIVGKYGLTQVPPRIQEELGMGLTVLSDDLSVEPGLAKRWEVSNDGKTYRFYLRDDVEWSDGKKVELDDLSFSVPDVEVNKIEPDVIEFVLPEPFSPFPVVLSKSVLRDGRFTIGEYEVSNIETNGPFLKLVTLENEESVLVFRFYDTTTLAVTAFKLGEVDELEGLFEEPDISAWKNVVTNRVTRSDFYVALFYNNDDPFLADKSIRQALSYGVEDKESGYQRAVGPINPSSWAYNSVVKKYDYDQARAKELLKDSLPPDTENVEIELSTTPDLLPVAEAVKSDWEEIGVKASIKVVASIPSGYQVLLAAQEIPTDPDQYLFWHSTQETNFTSFRSPKIDKLLEDGRQTLRQADRRQIYFDFQRFLAEEAPATFLYHPDAVLVSRGK